MLVLFWEEVVVGENVTKDIILIPSHGNMEFWELRKKESNKYFHLQQDLLANIPGFVCLFLFLWVLFHCFLIPLLI